MDFDGDPILKTDKNGDIDISITLGQPEMTGGLENAAFLSVFCSPWWGNEISSDDEKLESEFDTIIRKTLTNQVRLDAEQVVKNSLDWMESGGLVKKINISSSIPAVGNLGIFLSFEEPDATSDTIYRINWDSMGVKIS